jgi:hypothetical protein
LQLYGAHTVRSEGDITLAANRATGTGEQRDQALVILMARLTRPYHRAWLDSLVAAHVIDAVCPAGTADECRVSVTSSFLWPGDPTFVGDSEAVVNVTDRALNPDACRRHPGQSFGGEMHLRFRLAKRDHGWVVMDAHMEEGSTIIC